MTRRYRSLAAGAAITLLMSGPALGQGKSQQDHGNKGNTPRNNGSGSKGSNAGGPSAASPPSQVALPAAAAASGSTGVAPFAWVDNAALMDAGAVWIGLSFVRWQSSGLSEVSFPVVDAAFGVTPRVQLGASIPRVMTGDLEGQSSGVGTTFLHAKLGLLTDSNRPLQVAVAPTVEILGHNAIQWLPADQSRIQWGLPVSAQMDRGVSRVYLSSGYFSPGIWYAGGGFGAQVAPRVGVGLSFSRAWSTWNDVALAAPKRTDLSSGVSVDLTPNVGAFGSISRTIDTAPEYGAGTTISIGLSLSANRVVFTR